MAKYLDQNGLLYFWQKIVNKFVAKESGKGLSTNDFTTEEKNKLSGIAAGAQVNVKPDWNASSGNAAEILNKPTIPSKTSDLTNDSGFITEDQVPEGAVASNTTPKMDGTAAVGVETAFARGDHVHPSDTSKANTADVYAKTESYSKTEINEKGFLVARDIANKADKATTLAGYSIADAYTKTEVDNKVDAKADSANVYTKTETYTQTEVDSKLNLKANSATTLSGYGIADAYTKSEVDGKLSAVYKPAGNTLFANLPTPSASNLGNVYNMTDAFTTDSRFIDSEPTQYPIGTNVVVVQVEDAYYFDVLAGFVDLSGYLEVSDMVAITNQEIDTIVA